MISFGTIFFGEWDFFCATEGVIPPFVHDMQYKKFGILRSCGLVKQSSVNIQAALTKTWAIPNQPLTLERQIGYTIYLVEMPMPINRKLVQQPLHILSEV